LTTDLFPHTLVCGRCSRPLCSSQNTRGTPSSTDAYRTSVRGFVEMGPSQRNADPRSVARSLRTQQRAWATVLPHNRSTPLRVVLGVALRRCVIVDVPRF